MDNMEEQFVGLSNNDATHIAKGKRTKRMRLLSPCGVVAATTVMTSSCSSASGCDYGSFSSYESTDQEEEDMANCLILLAQGGGATGGGDSNHHHHHHHHHQQLDEDHDHDHDGNKMDQKGSTKIAITATNTNTKAGFFIYECKTCNRTFPSFQALGGHRASHKKPKVNMAEEKKPPLPQPPSPPPSSQPQVITNHDIQFQEAGQQTHIKSSLQLGGSHGHKASTFHGNKAKIHECSICGSEFTSGQALGGHMRRHRASTNTTTTTQVVGISTIDTATTTTTAVRVPPRSILQLDLNLPAPEDDLREPKFQFTATKNSMVLSAAPALVDCHY
ncbi:zinc finger protein ZAT5-like [Gastrolobium bilobum]|uniref:zinc finger protein ZAT5-like n=1 Tax=Gastrolobium bilobum TaxID=150636 RepID=UPI002AB1467D|nr:zinc finger protein ZAT5-like [Gastrolobium bilobum]